MVDELAADSDRFAGEVAGVAFKVR